MKRHLRALFATGCFLAVPPVLADGPGSTQTSGFAELRVGRTSILCYQEPCPWNGVSAADGPIAPQQLLWSGDMPPPMRGTTEDRIHLLEHYREQCTLITGRFRQGILEVAEVHGPC